MVCDEAMTNGPCLRPWARRAPCLRPWAMDCSREATISQEHRMIGATAHRWQSTIATRTTQQPEWAHLPRRLGPLPIDGGL